MMSQSSTLAGLYSCRGATILYIWTQKLAANSNLITGFSSQHYWVLTELKWVNKASSKCTQEMRSLFGDTTVCSLQPSGSQNSLHASQLFNGPFRWSSSTCKNWKLEPLHWVFALNWWLITNWTYLMKRSLQDVNNVLIRSMDILLIKGYHRNMEVTVICFTLTWYPICKLSIMWWSKMFQLILLSQVSQKSLPFPLGDFYMFTTQPRLPKHMGMGMVLGFVG